MKKLSIILALLFAPAKAYLQWEMSSVQKDVSAYLKAIEDQDLEKMISYVNPAVLEVIPETEFLNLFSGIFDDPEFMISYSNGTFVDATKIVSDQGTKYRTVFYTTQLNLTIPEMEASEDLLELMKYQYGEKNVKYHEADSKIEVMIIDWMYAIKNPTDTNWTFLTGNANYLVENLIPQIVIDTFALEVVNWMAQRI